MIIGLLLWGLMTHSTYAGTGDEPHYLAIAHSLAFDRDLHVDNNYGPDEWITNVAPGTHVAAGREGTTRPVHDVGLPLLLAPYVAMARPAVRWALSQIPPAWLERMRLEPETLYRHALSAGMILVALLLADQLLATLLALGIASGAATGTVLLVALSPPLAIYSILFFTELLSALLALIAFRKLVVAGTRGTNDWAIAGVVTGLLLLVHARNVGIVLAILAIAAVVWRRERIGHHAIAFTGAFGAILVARSLLTYWLWGTWFTTPHARGGEWIGLGDAVAVGLRRMAGLLLDQEYGLLIYAPIFTLIVLLFFGRRDTRTVQLALWSVIAAYLIPILLPYTNVHGWTGGWSPAARLWVPIVPLLAVALALAFTKAPRPLVVTAVAVQVAISAYFWQNPKNLWNDGDGTAAVCERGGFTGCSALPSFVRPSDAIIPPDAGKD
jgi:hypothetical protein